MTHGPFVPEWSRRSWLIATAALALPRFSRRGDPIDDLIADLMRRNPTPGVAVAVVRAGRVVWAKGYGSANLERNLPMTPDSLLNVGSVTKTVTVTAVMQLVEAKRLQLDDDIDRVLRFPVRNPKFPDRPITVRHLLTHTSSISDGEDYDASYACGDPADPLAGWVERYLRPAGARFKDHSHFTEQPPGAHWQYSNVGFGLLGVVVEVVSGESYADYTTKHVFEPLRMTSTGWYLRRIDRARHAVPYRYVTQGPATLERLNDPSWKPAAHPAPTFVPHCLYSFPTLPDGLMRTSVRDLARLLGAYQSGGTLEGARILQPETVGAILTPQPMGPVGRGMPVAQGLAWYRQRGEDSGLWVHGGGDPGIRTFVGLAPNGTAVAVITNCDGGRPNEIATRVLAPS